MSYVLVIIGACALVILIFIITKNATRILHRSLLIWKYFNKASIIRGKKVWPIDGKVDECNSEELRYYVMSCLLWHYPSERIVEACTSIGWDKEVVEGVIEREKKRMKVK